MPGPAPADAARDVLDAVRAHVEQITPVTSIQLDRLENGPSTYLATIGWVDGAGTATVSRHLQALPGAEPAHGFGASVPVGEQRMFIALRRDLTPGAALALNHHLDDEPGAADADLADVDPALLALWETAARELCDHGDAIEAATPAFLVLLPHVYVRRCRERVEALHRALKPTRTAAA